VATIRSFAPRRKKQQKPQIRGKLRPLASWLANSKSGQPHTTTPPQNIDGLRAAAWFNRLAEPIIGTAHVAMDHAAARMHGAAGHRLRCRRARATQPQCRKRCISARKPRQQHANLLKFLLRLL
jgi:hypothetical protein